MAQKETKAVKQAFYKKYVGTSFAEAMDGKDGSYASLREYVDDTTAERRAADVEYHASMEAWQVKWAASEAKRIKREAKNPAAAMNKAREAEQREAMADERDEARKDAGADWSDTKDEWVEDWIKAEWSADWEAEFVARFKAQWLKEHGTPFPDTE